MLHSDVISDEFWVVLEPVLTAVPVGVVVHGKEHPGAGSDRFRGSAPIRLGVNLEHFGPWQLVWQSHRRWSVDGKYGLKESG